MATKHRLNSSMQSDPCCTSKLNLDVDWVRSKPLFLSINRRPSMALLEHAHRSPQRPAQ